jgi:hypothetical protein
MTENAQANIEKIARSLIGLETLKTRNSDSLDFHEIPVWELKRVLEEAYELGRRSK